MEFVKYKRENGIGKISHGFCWQYLYLNSGKDRIVCSLRKPGDYIFLASDIFGVKDEAIVYGSLGCKIDWNQSLPIEIDIDILSKEKNIIVTSLQINNNIYMKSARKAYSPLDTQLLQRISLRSAKNQTFPDNPGIVELLGNESAIYVPKSLSNLIFGNKYDLVHNLTLDQAPHYQISINSSSSDVAHQLQQFFNSEYSYSLFYSTIVVPDTNVLKGESSLIESLGKLNINFKKIDDALSFSLKNASPDDFVLIYCQDELTYSGLIKNLRPELLTENTTVYAFYSPPLSEISFFSFWNELKRSPFALSLIISLSFVIQLLTIAVPLLFQQIIDKVISQQNPPLLPILVSLMIAFALFGGVFRASRQLIVFDLADRADERFSEIVLKKLIGIKYSFFSNSKQGDVASRVQDVANIRQFFTGPVISTALDLVFSVVYLSVLILYSPFLTLVSFAPMPVYMGLVFFGAPIYKKLVRARATKRALLFSFVLEVIGGIQSVKLQGFGSQAIKLWREKFLSQQQTALEVTSFAAVFSEIGSFCTQLSGILILLVGVGLVLNGELSLGELIAFRIISNFLTAPLLRLSSLWQSYQETQISMERVNKIVQFEQESQRLSCDFEPGCRALSVRNLSFAYTKNRTVLSDISFNIQPNTKVAVVGRSGSGKSTLLKLLTLLYESSSGEITLGSKNIELISAQKLRETIYCVPQDSHFIGGTVEDNLRYGWLDSTEEDILKILRDVCMEEIFDNPYGINMKVQEGGTNFSGGQKQRLAIGRMLLRKPPIVLLDEATSALDSITESKILDTIATNLPNSTVVYITHRIHTARKADKIIVLEDGYLIANGTYEDILDSCDVFRDMVERGVNE